MTSTSELSSPAWTVDPSMIFAGQKKKISPTGKIFPEIQHGSWKFNMEAENHNMEAESHTNPMDRPWK